MQRLYNSSAPICRRNVHWAASLTAASRVTMLTYRCFIKVQMKMMPLIYIFIQQMLTNCVSLHPPWLQSMWSLQQADLLALPKTMENFGS
jgi:hypothetical protein